MDQLLPFLFDELPLRGGIVRLHSTWQEMLQRRDYPAELIDLLGQALGAVALMGATLKDRSMLTLQIQGDGPIHLLVAQRQPQGRLRALARWQEILPQTTNLLSLVGTTSRLAMTLDAEDTDHRYQSLVEIKAEDLSTTLADYFAESEQLPTVIRLICNQQEIVGILLQQLPGQQIEAWHSLADTVLSISPTQFSSDPVELLVQLFPDVPIRTFAPQMLRFGCNCSQERSQKLLLGIGHEEIAAVVAEQGAVTVTCEFCGADYSFDQIDINHLFMNSE